MVGDPLGNPNCDDTLIWAIMWDERDYVMSVVYFFIEFMLIDFFSFYQQMSYVNKQHRVMWRSCKSSSLLAHF